MNAAYTYAFESDLDFEDARGTLLLARLATECLHGSAQVQLDASYQLNPTRRVCVVDAGTPVGRDLNRLLSGFLRTGLDQDAFRIERNGPAPLAAPVAVS